MTNPSPAITFRADLSRLTSETIGPVTNAVEQGVLHPDAFQSPDQGRTENANRVNTISAYLPTFKVSPDKVLKHGDEFIEYGLKALYLRNMYGVGYAPADRAVLVVVSVD